MLQNDVHQFEQQLLCHQLNMSKDEVHYLQEQLRKKENAMRREQQVLIELTKLKVQMVRLSV